MATITTIDPDHLVAQWRDVLIIVWREQTTMPAVHELRACMRSFAGARPQGMAMFVIVEERASLPSSEARAELASMLRGVEAGMSASCVTMEGEGFRAAAVRSVLTGLSFIVRPSYPHRVFGSLADSTAWLASVCGERLRRRFTGDELHEVVAELRARADAPARAG